MTFDLERARPATLAGLAVALALLIPTGVLSFSRTFYDASGRVSGHSTTDSGGATTIYDASGRVTGRTATSGNQTTIYDASGRNVGRVTTTKPQGK
jgi:YD repeat-containing protein